MQQGGNADPLVTLINDVCTAHTDVRSAARKLRLFVEAQARQRSPESFTKFMEELNRRIFDLVNSLDLNMKIGGVSIIDELIDVPYEENDTKTMRFANYLRMIFLQGDDKIEAPLLELAAKTFGHLVRTGGTLTASIMEIEIKRALEWLQSNQSEQRRYSAVLLLRELAENAPTLFNLHISLFINRFGIVMHDPKQLIRERAVLALRSCLALIAKKDRQWRSDWYYTVFRDVQQILQSSNSSGSSIHGALLTIGELLQHTGEFMLPRFQEICDSTLKLKDHHDQLVQDTVIRLLPRLAVFSPQIVIGSYLDVCMNHLINTMRNSHAKSRGAAFVAVGEMAKAIGQQINAYLVTIMGLIKEAISSNNRNSFVPEALSCLSLLSQAVSENLRPHILNDVDIIGQMFSAGLSSILVDALTQLSSHIPELLPASQDCLLHCILQILMANRAGTNAAVVDLELKVSTHSRIFRDKVNESSLYCSPSTLTLILSPLNRPSTTKSWLTGIPPLNTNGNTQNIVAVDSQPLLISLEVLRTFNFTDYNLLPFAVDFVVFYMDHDTAAIRKQAALAVSCILVRSAELHQKSPRKKSNELLVHTTQFVDLVSDTLERLMTMCVSDPDPSIRLAILASFSPQLDSRLAHVKNLHSLCVALSDEVIEIREAALAMLGRLALINPATVLPLLRTTLIQLLTELQYANDCHTREQSCRLLGCMIDATRAFVQPFLETILDVLQPQLVDTDAAVSSCALSTLGKLATIAGREIQLQHFGRIISIVVRILQSENGSSTLAMQRREVALRTLGELIKSTGYVIQPYFKFPGLLPLMLHILTEGRSSINYTSTMGFESSQTGNTGTIVAMTLVRSGSISTESGNNSNDNITGLVTSAPPAIQPNEWSVRLEVIKLLGIIGALDPYMFRKLPNIHQPHIGAQQKATAEDKAQILHLDDSSTIATIATANNNNNNDNLSSEIETSLESKLVVPSMFASPNEYYSFVAVGALTKVLRQATLSQHFGKTTQALMFVAKSMGISCVRFLPDIVPPFLSLIRTAENVLRESLLMHITTLVVQVKQHIRAYLSDILSILYEFWNNIYLLTHHILNLVEELTLALQDEFVVHLYDVIPRLLNIFQADKSEDCVATIKVLHTIEVISGSLEDHLYLVIPALLQLIEQQDVPLEIRRAAASTLGSLCSKLDLTEYSSRIVHVIVRVIDSLSFIPFTSSSSYPAASITSSTATPTSPSSASFSLQKIDAFRTVLVNTLCHLACQLGESYAVYISAISKVLSRQKIKHEGFQTLVSKIQAGEGFIPADLGLSAEEKLEQGSDLNAHSDSNGEYSGVTIQHTKLLMSQQNLKKAWESSQRSTKEDWVEWMRGFSIELLKESPSPALRTCSALAQNYNPLARELLNAAFISCWTEIPDEYQDDLVRNIELALDSPNIPPEVLQTLLNLAEFMEHDDKRLPIEIRALGNLAEKCHVYSKALHYKELEFHIVPGQTIDALISINNQLQQPEAAVGILTYAKQYHSQEVRESWYEKLQRWEDALEAYERKQLEDPADAELTLGRMRCLRALGDAERMARLAQNVWLQSDDPNVRKKVAPMGAYAAWNLRQWSMMETYVNAMDNNHLESEFLRAVVAVLKDDYNIAQESVDRARELLDTELTALVGESYNRAYHSVVQAQQLAELEEVITYKQCESAADRARIRKMWNERLQGCQRNVDVWQQVLEVRSLVVSPEEDAPTWLKFSSLCRKNGRLGLSLFVLHKLLGEEEAAEDEIKYSSRSASASVDSSSSENSDIFAAATTTSPALLPIRYPAANFALLKHMWAIGFRYEALRQMQTLVERLNQVPSAEHPYMTTKSQPMTQAELSHLKARCYLKFGNWQLAISDDLDDDDIPVILNRFHNATLHNPSSYKAWHAWAVMNFRAISHYRKGLSVMNNSSSTSDNKEQENDNCQKSTVHVVPAIKGFFRSIALAGERALQDILRLLTLWFQYGASPDAEAALFEGFNNISIDTWLAVVPQIIARIDIASPVIRRLIHDLLCKIGKAHPQALIYPLTVASKSQVMTRQSAAINILNDMRQHSQNLVEQSIMVSRELIRVSILWYEMWHEALEEASRQWFGQQNIEGMLATLAPLYELMTRGPETPHEVAFRQGYGQELQEAREWCQKYERGHKESDISQAWNLYSDIFHRLAKQKAQYTNFELQQTSPHLNEALNLELAVPGTYRAGQQIIRIASFVPFLRVIESIQRPRKLQMRGSDGRVYAFLLKGHEDLRQDERVMQLFGLVNTLLSNDRETAKKDLHIRGYSVIPLSPNSGLIQWLANCDTLHTLIKEYRDAHQILLNIEHRLMLQVVAEYDKLTLMQKVEAFEYALLNTTGRDLYRVLWLKSRDSEVWLERRTNYTRSLALMSMVGYILGLGDRHPSNLMLDRMTGKIIHIDFGDCFEVAMQREKYPEKIPFRLTRMLINAMEVSGIEGNFRSTCESVMRVLRDNKESVIAVLEAFVYDPLISWRLLKTTKATLHAFFTKQGKAGSNRNTMTAQLLTSSIVSDDLKQERELEMKYSSSANSSPEALNVKALKVLGRIEDKLTGKDFGKETGVLDVPDQVQQLIQQATSHINLCQCYSGWCPFW